MDAEVVLFGWGDGGVPRVVDVDAEGAAFDDVEKVAMVALRDDLELTGQQCKMVSYGGEECIVHSSMTPSRAASVVPQQAKVGFRGRGEWNRIAHLDVLSRNDLLNQRPNNDIHLRLPQPPIQRMSSNALLQPCQLRLSLRMVRRRPLIIPTISRIQTLSRHTRAASHAITAWETLSAWLESAWWPAGLGVVG